MGVPALQKTWTISANNRLVYVDLGSIPLVVGAYLRGLADFLLANGYTCKGSSDGTTAAMDGTYRWLTDADAATRGASTVAAQSWVVVTDGNGCDICIAYQGSSDERGRISFSPSGDYSAAGTATFTPTAPDEQLFLSNQPLVDSTTSLDQIWFGWADANAQLCRFCVVRNGALVGNAWGVERVNKDFNLSRPFDPPVWGFDFSPSGMVWTTSGALGAYSSGTRGGRAQVEGINIVVGGSAQTYAGNPVSWFSTKPALLSGKASPSQPLFLGTTTTSMDGPVGNPFDWWSSPAQESTVPMNVFPGGDWVCLTSATTSGVAWPWDGSTFAETA